MSNVSDLLNPAPSTKPPQTTSQPPPLLLDGQDHRAHTTMSSQGPAGSPARHNLISSPGLDALAAAAVHIAPLASPTQSISPLIGTNFPQQGHRRQSSHGISPGYASQQQSTFASGLEQYHLPTNNERRMSSLEESLQILPPMVENATQVYSSVPTIEPGDRPRDAINGTTARDMGQLPTPARSMGPEQPQELRNGAPATAQIRQPSLGPARPHPATAMPEAQSEQVEVKTEMAENLLDPPQAKREHSTSTNGETAATVAALLAYNEKNGTLDTHATPLSKPKPPQSRKRAAPKSGKKGTASAVKPAAKKRKIDSDSVDGTPSGQRSGTPATSQASMTPAPKNRKQNSMTPTRSSSVAVGDDDDYDDDTALYCLCRKPDDHKVMIGCDGPCEDWFHMKCVDMDDEKVALISRWYCPNCAAQGNETLWKRMCRLEGCRKPASIDEEKGSKSKYCSKEHGEEFMRRLVGKSTPEGKKGLKPNSDRKKSETTIRNARMRDRDPDGSDPDDHAYLRGGQLRPGELKALVDGVDDVSTFRKLGDGVLSPPNTASPEVDGIKKEKIPYTEAELAVLEHVTNKRDEFNARKTMLADRGKFILMVESRRKAVLAEMKEKDKSLKDICGYDPRLTWSDEEFNQFCVSPLGAQMLESGILEAPSSAEAQKESGNIDDDDGIGRGVCKKKRCERHRQWMKLQQQDNAFEKDLVRQGLRKLEGEEKGVMDRAMIRSLEGEQAERE